jgi:lipopolysaccharide export LptBFGC system permease protein LptF
MAIGELKIISPMIAAWSPNILTGGIGWYILSRSTVR